MKTRKGAALAAAFILGSSILYPMPSLAVCYSGHPTPTVELRETRMVIKGRAISSQVVMSEEDPDIVGKTIYQVKVVRTYKGHPPPTLSIVEENTSSRFPMDEGVDYLLFVSEYGGERFVNACGNSGRVDDRRSLMKKLGLHP